MPSRRILNLAPPGSSHPFTHPLPRHDDPKIKFFHQSRRWYNVPSRWGRQHEIADRSATVNPLGRSHNDRHPRKCILAGAEDRYNAVAG